MFGRGKEGVPVKTAIVVPSSHPALPTVPEAELPPRKKTSFTLPLTSLQLLCAKAGRSTKSTPSVSIVATDVKSFALTAFIVDISFYVRQASSGSLAWLLTTARRRVGSEISAEGLSKSLCRDHNPLKCSSNSEW